MPTLKDRLEVKRREPGACSQAGIITWHIHDILTALEHGMTYQAILDVMKEEGVTLSVSRFRDAVNRAKRKLTKSVGVSGSTRHVAITPLDVQPVPRPIKIDPPASRTHVAVPVTATLVSAFPAATNSISGWELEHQDAIIPPELLKKAFVEIAGIRVDLRQPCPAEFGEKGEEVKHQVNPSSPNWPEFKARARARITYAQDLSYWQREFKKWLVSQGYTGAQY